jgi:hypothetical protein
MNIKAHRRKETVMSIFLSSSSWDLTWWGTMVVIGFINFTIAVFIFFKLLKWKQQEPRNSKYFLSLRVLGAIFVSVALYRTIFVSSYPNRLAWFNTILNSPFVIRCLALFAELSFMGVIVIILLRLCKETEISIDRKNNRLIHSMLEKSPYFAFGCILLAQFFAFAGLITEYLAPFAIEETLWALAFLSIVPLVISGLKQKSLEKSYKQFLVILAIWCGGYLAFQCFYALPFSYYANLAQDIGKVIPSDALQQSISGFTSTRDFDKWGGLGFFIWHSGYFSLCTWMVLFFMTAPRKCNHAENSRMDEEEPNKIK